MKTSRSFSLITALAVALTAAPVVSFSQVASAALNFAAQLGTENAIVTNRLSLTNTHTQSGVAAGGVVMLNNAVLNQNSSYTTDAYAFRAYGQLTLSGSDQSLNGGASLVQNGSTNVGLKDFAVNGGNQRVLTFGPNAGSTPQLAFNGNSGPPAPANFIGAADTYFTSRATALTTASSIFASASATAIAQSGSTLTFTANAGSIAVFNWDVTARGAINQVAINAPLNSTIVINVLNGGTTWNPGSLNFVGSAAMSATASRVLWNLEGGLDLTTTNDWWGSILGINSTITANGNLNGQIFSEDLISNSRELHYVAFSPIPEPSSFAIVAGLAALACVMYRRQRLPV